MTTNELRKAFSKVRKTFFPRWDLRERWRVRWGDLGKSDGNCDFEHKEITISTGLDSGKLMLVLIHEVAHAVTRDRTHEKKWKVKMEKVAQQAEKHGQKELAVALRAEVMWYQNATKCSEEDRIEEIIDEMVLANPSIDLEEILIVLCFELGKSREELLELHSPKIEEFYNKSRQYA